MCHLSSPPRVPFALMGLATNCPGRVIDLTRPGSLSPQPGLDSHLSHKSLPGAHWPLAPLKGCSHRVALAVHHASSSSLAHCLGPSVCYPPVQLVVLVVREVSLHRLELPLQIAGPGPRPGRLTSLYKALFGIVSSLGDLSNI